MPRCPAPHPALSSACTATRRAPCTSRPRRSPRSSRPSSSPRPLRPHPPLPTPTATARPSSTWARTESGRVRCRTTGPCTAGKVRPLVSRFLPRLGSRADSLHRSQPSPTPLLPSETCASRRPAPSRRRTAPCRTSRTISPGTSRRASSSARPRSLASTLRRAPRTASRCALPALRLVEPRSLELTRSVFLPPAALDLGARRRQEGRPAPRARLHSVRRVPLLSCTPTLTNAGFASLQWRRCARPRSSLLLLFELPT